VTFSALPREIISRLALPMLGEYPAETVEGASKVTLAANAIIRIEDRIVQSPIIIRPSSTTPLIGAVVFRADGL